MDAPTREDALRAKEILHRTIQSKEAMTPAENALVNRVIAWSRANTESQRKTKSVDAFFQRVGTMGTLGDPALDGPGQVPAPSDDAFGDPDFKLGVGRFPGKSIHRVVTERLAGKKAVIESGTMLVPATRDGELFLDPMKPAFLHDLIPTKLIDSKAFTFLRQSVRDNQAAVVAEGAQKPTSIYTLTEEEGEVKQHAHMSEFIPNALFEDSSMLLGWLQSEMSYGLDLSIEDDAVTTIVSDPDVLAEVYAGNIFATIRKGVTRLQARHISPTVLVLHQNDAEAIDLETDFEGRYYFNGPQGAGSSPVWSVPVLVSDAAPEGTGILANATAALRRYVRGTAKFDVDSMTRFDTNETRTRLEGRSAVAVVRPFAIVLVDLGTGS